MRLGLIGSTGHWQTYAPAIEHVAGLTLVAVAPAGPEETTDVFDHAPGLTIDTRRHDDAQKMLKNRAAGCCAGLWSRRPDPALGSDLPGMRAANPGREAAGDGPAHPGAGNRDAAKRVTN